MTQRDDIRAAVLEALILLIPECSENLEDSTCPIRELGITSKDGAEFALDLEDLLGCQIDKILNPLVDDEKKRPRNIGEIVNWLDSLLQRQKKELLSGAEAN